MLGSFFFGGTEYVLYLSTSISSEENWEGSERNERDDTSGSPCSHAKEKRRITAMQWVGLNNIQREREIDSLKTRTVSILLIAFIVGDTHAHVLRLLVRQSISSSISRCLDGCATAGRYLLSSRLAQLFSCELIVVICFAGIDKRNLCKMFHNERAYIEFARRQEEITEQTHVDGEEECSLCRCGKANKRRWRWSLELWCNDRNVKTTTHRFLSLFPGNCQLSIIMEMNPSVRSLFSDMPMTMHP